MQELLEFYLPIIKSEQQEDGRILVHGLASDHNIDLEGEIVKASANPGCIEYPYQKFDWIHSSMKKPGAFVGDVVKAQIIPEAEAKKKYPTEAPYIKGDPLEVEGFVYGLGDHPEIAPEVVKSAHYYLKNGQKMGFSIFGGRQGKTSDGATIPGFIPTIAITPQPVLPSTCCYVAKSLAAAMGSDCEEVEVAEVPGYTQPRLYVLKALQTTGIIATEGMTGGDALKESDIGNVQSEKKQKCSKCSEDIVKGSKYCPLCGEEQSMTKSFAEYVQEIGDLLVKGDSVRGYCIKCKRKMRLTDVEHRGNAHHRKAVGKCPECGTEVHKFKAQLEKSVKGEGSRGGKVIGHTKSGKAVYAPKHIKYNSLLANKARLTDTQASTKVGKSALKEFDNYSMLDHEDAMRMHHDMANKADIKARRAKSDTTKIPHLVASAMHRSAAEVHDHACRTFLRKRGWRDEREIEAAVHPGMSTNSNLQIESILKHYKIT